ncbi:hypothetical protein GCM10025867_27230 [Frondihabitans sucicola]|uniref:Secreted protein n=1 Tax=Frondihabitans sucicola TaxID=1268041 RepID=A0ABN6XZK1_9MICO|nr:hypothetical protein [Frondihabitans sucicola]BDZ50482.1 hypothetical protein GCM10025867_27230 [Frondihabitans sucicola]
MRAVVIAVAAVVSILAVVKSRRAASEIKKNVKASRRRGAVTHAVHQKAGQVDVPKLPKVKRY